MHRTLRSLILLGLLAAPGISSALTSLCVSNSQQLASALQSVNAGADNLILVKLRRGTYAPLDGGSGFTLDLTASGRVVEISGGWTGAGSSCTHKNLSASGTLIVGDAGGSALAFDLAAGSNTTLAISDLTITTPGGGDGACLYGEVRAATTATVERVRLERCISNSYSGSFRLVNSGGEATVRNVVARGGSGTRTGGITVESQAGITRLNHLSITANRARQGGNPGGLYINCLPPAEVYLGNSVIWGNVAGDTPNDIVNSGNCLAISHIRYGVRSGWGTANSSSTGDPGFVAFGNPGPRSGSPLIDTGLASVAGGPGSFDVDGLSRIQGGVADIGAHEGAYAGDEIFRDIQP